MKDKIKKSIFLVFIFILCYSFFGIAQEDPELYDKLLNSMPRDWIKEIYGQYKFTNNKEQRHLAIQNVNKHLKNIAKLRAQQIKEEDSQEYFAAQRIVAGTGKISGVVYESDGIIPVQNRVYINIYDPYDPYDTYWDYVGAYLIEPGENGIYTISGLPTGDYYIYTNSENYVDEYYNDVTNWREATLVRVIDGQETSGINFILELKQQHEGTILGQVSGVEKTFLDKCEIKVYSENYNIIDSALTDERGLYTINCLPNGGYKLKVEYYGSENYVDEWYDNAQNFKTASIISVTEPDTFRNINFILDYGGAIAGCVFDETGKALYCKINVYDVNGNLIDYTATFNDGSFIVSKLPTGIYKLHVQYYQYYGEGNYLDCWYNRTENFYSANPIYVTTPDTTKNINITLQKAGAISGQVFGPDGQPLAESDFNVIAYDECQKWIKGGTKSENGKYSILQLPSGRYKLFVRYRYNNVLGPGLASEWYDGVYEFEDAKFIEVIAPDSVTNINFTLKEGGYITGRIYDPGKLLLHKNGIVCSYNLKGSWSGGGTVLDDGSYCITGLSAGEYKLFFTYYTDLWDGEKNYPIKWYDGKLHFETANPVKVIASHETMNIDFTLESPGILQGLISDASGNQLENIFSLSETQKGIEVFIYDAISGEFIDRKSVSLVGGFQFDLLPGNYKLAAISYHSNGLPEHDSLAVSYYDCGTYFNDPNTQAISITENTMMKLNNFVMQKAPGAISGTIYDQKSGMPIKNGNYMVIAFDKDGYIAKASCYYRFNDKMNPINGEYLLCGLRPGDYYICTIIDGVGSFDDSFCQWYGGIEDYFNISNLEPKVTIPLDAIDVTVGEGLTSGIDFDFKFMDIDKQEIKTTENLELRNNYPNPFNLTTTLEYILPQYTYVEIDIFNILGQKVETLVAQHQAKGLHVVTWDAGGLPSGIYFYKIEAGYFKQTKKCLLLK